MTNLTLDDLFRLTRRSNSFVVRVGGAAGQQPPPRSMGADARKESYRAHLADIAKRKLHLVAEFSGGALLSLDPAGGCLLFQNGPRHWETRWQHDDPMRLVIRRRLFSGPEEFRFLGHMNFVGDELILKIKGEPDRSAKVNIDLLLLGENGGRPPLEDSDAEQGDLTEEDLARIRGQLPDVGRYARERGG